MKFEVVKELLCGVPYMAEDEGWELYNFICKEKPSSILELGHAHGASTIYMAAALDEIGSGVIETVDLSAAQDRDPNLEKLTLDSGLNEFINIFREKNSYTWFLKKKIENCTSGYICEPIYDFCFIDGPKNWTIDGLAFFLVNKLLKNKAWILFDDYLWTHGKHDGRESTDGITVRSLGNEELEEPHIKLIFELLVMQSGEFSNFKIQDNWWAWAQKSKSGSKVLEHTSKMMTKN